MLNKYFIYDLIIQDKLIP